MNLRTTLSRGVLALAALRPQAMAGIISKDAQLWGGVVRTAKIKVE